MEFLKWNTQKTDGNNGNNEKIAEADNGWMKAKKAVDDAIYNLGKAYFEANKQNAESEFSKQIQEIHDRNKEEYIWHQYRLNVEGQRMCDGCHSIITADSAFCNRCGRPVDPIDFSVIVDTAKDIKSSEASNSENTCPKCGKKFPEGAKFCESCGTKIN